MIRRGLGIILNFALNYSRIIEPCFYLFLWDSSKILKFLFGFWFSFSKIPPPPTPSYTTPYISNYAFSIFNLILFDREGASYMHSLYRQEGYQVYPTTDLVSKQNTKFNPFQNKKMFTYMRGQNVQNEGREGFKTSNILPQTRYECL